MKQQIGIIFFLLFSTQIFSQAPKVLVITAHPDDESVFSVTLFKIAKELKGSVDMLVMTDGGGGFADAHLGAIYFGLPLTDSIVARTHLPMIRKQEILNAGKIMGIRNMFFMEQPDDLYSKNLLPYINGEKWNIPYVESRIDQILSERNYDFIITLLPHVDQHAHHKTAVVLGLRAVQRFKGASKPIIIAGNTYVEGDKPFEFSSLPGFPETKIKPNAPQFTLNRAYKFAENDKLSYKIVADWVIAEYKSQGAIQEHAMHVTDSEIYSYFDINDDNGILKVKKLFEDLAKSGFQPVNKKQAF